MEVQKRKQRLMWLIAMNLLVIWGNSLLPGEISGAISDEVKAFVNQFFMGDGLSGASGSFLLRKLAHFSEFTCLGLLLAFQGNLLGRKKRRSFSYGALAACMDETIQRFVPGRGPSIRDVGIDVSGVVTGLCIFLILSKCKKQKS